MKMSAAYGPTKYKVARVGGLARKKRVRKNRTEKTSFDEEPIQMYCSGSFKRRIPERGPQAVMSMKTVITSIAVLRAEGLVRCSIDCQNYSSLRDLQVRRLVSQYETFEP